MDRRSWFGYQPAAVREARQAANATFEDELAHLHAEEVSLRERLLQLRAEEERLTVALSQVEQTEEALRSSLTGSIDRESAQLQAVSETYSQEVLEQRLRIADLQRERERIARVESSLIATIRGALASHSLQEGERS
ncbi:MAG TPA: hypothetical protein VK191_09425 [Symbiobacteriaceae bacterium]|nr:hypothetical protein [Symbiobacteriaceae bacterium]